MSDLEDSEIIESMEYLTYEQVGIILRVSKMTVSRYVKRKVNPLPVVYLNQEAMKTPRIKMSDLKAWIEQLEDPKSDI